MMSSVTLLEKFRNEVELTPVPGFSDLHIIQSVRSDESASGDAQMTEADWDQFEADIKQAFEQLP